MRGLRKFSGGNTLDEFGVRTNVFNNLCNTQHWPLDLIMEASFYHHIKKVYRYSIIYLVNN